LLAVLDWGLGHASRCVPLVESWLAAGDRVTVASAGPALALLQASVPAAEFLNLPAYAVRYPGKNMVWNMAQQGPRLARVIGQERRVLQQFLRTQTVDQIVSDGRFGCYHPAVESIWLAHQLHIQYPQPVLAQGANAVYHAYLRRHFQAVWIPDRAGDGSLAGRLSQPVARLPHRYLGPLSRFAQAAPAAPAPTAYPWLALLSGPEPQRSLLEQEIRHAFARSRVRALIVRGVPGSTAIQPHPSGIDTVNWLLGADLHRQVLAAERLVCRSGYSTLMDLHYWQKPALLVPTPGQTEQEYLARYWAGRDWATWQEQGALRI
jgi:hypothetical protein